jgi:hypothetical protein
MDELESEGCDSLLSFMEQAGPPFHGPTKPVITISCDVLLSEFIENASDGEDFQSDNDPT